jgi:acyl dehydratase
MTTYVTPEMEAARGSWSDERTSPPISVSDIRKWAIATYWPEKPPRVYWDEEYARTTRWGGIIAPPDFNPFAWPVERPQLRGGGPQPRRPDGKPLTGMNGGQTDTYGVPMRPGDVVTTRTRLKDWEEREGRLGHTLFTYTEIEWRNQRDELVKRRISIGIRY